MSHDFNLSGVFQIKTPTSKKHSRTRSRAFDYGDRFIPSRSVANKSVQLHNITNENTPAKNTPDTPNKSQSETKSLQEFNEQLAESLLNASLKTSKILSFSSPAVAERKTDEHHKTLRVLYSKNQEETLAGTPSRLISGTPERVLDAPELLDDYYLNLLDWSSSNMLAVGLGSNLYTWNATTGGIDLLVGSDDPDNHITSVRWSQDARTIAVGCNDKTVQLWDVESKTLKRKLQSHALRVSALAWHGSTLSSGSRDAMIFNHDARAASSTTHTLQGHEEEICGLSWSDDGQLASGGNDNLCCIWDRRYSTPKYTFEQHTAAVKALAWCPFQRNTLATGGGTADRHIRFFNTQNGTLINAVDTKSQVCSLVWSKTEKELLSAHGFSQNQLTVWKFPSMTPMATLTGHTSRVLHTALSPDGTTVCSAAADETLRFWNVWQPQQKEGKHAQERLSMLSRNIR